MSSKTSSRHVDLEQEWQRARDLLEHITRDPEDLIAFGDAVDALRRQYAAQGARNDVAEEAIRVPKAVAEGWQRKVKAELGITHQSAQRAIDRAMYLKMMRCLIDGEDVDYEDANGKDAVVYATPESKRLAQQAVRDVCAGLANAGRAWAGLAGEADRVGEDGIRERAPVNHSKNLLRAVRSLATSAKAWDALPPQERAAVEEKLFELRDVVPSTWESILFPKKRG